MYNAGLLLNLRSILRVAFVSLSVLCVPLPLYALEEDFRVDVSVQADKAAPQIIWETLKPVIRFQINNDKERTFIELAGKIQKKDVNLILNTVKVTRNPQGKFILRFDVNSPARTAQFESVDEKGSVHTFVLDIKFPQWDLYQRMLSADNLRTPWRISPGLSYTSLSYNQTFVHPISESNITAKLGLQYFITPSVWDIGFSGYYTLMNLTSTPSTLKLQFLGINGRVGYTLTPKLSRFKVRLMSGWYYLTTISTARIGFQNVGGPLLFPTFDYVISEQRSVGFYLKYAPMVGGVSSASLSNAEIAGGASYSFPLEPYLQTFHVNLDVSSLNLTVGAAAVQTTTFNLGIGTSF